MAGVRRGGKGERRTREAREDRTREDCGKGHLQRRNCFLHSTHWTVECLAVKITQSESRHFFRDKICGRQLACVASVSVEQRAKNGVFGVLLHLLPCNSLLPNRAETLATQARRQWVLVFLVFVVLREKIYFKIWRSSDVGKSEKRPAQKESNCNNVCRVCQVNLKVTYGKCVAKAYDTAHDFCVISAGKLARARTQRKKFPSS